MKKRKTILIISAFLIVVSAGVYLFVYALPSDFGKRPFYNLSIDDVIKAEISQSSITIDGVTEEMTQEEISTLVSLLRKLKIKGTTDSGLTGQSEWYGDNIEYSPIGGFEGTENFFLTLKNGHRLPIGLMVYTDTASVYYSSNVNRERFIAAAMLKIDYVAYELSIESLSDAWEIEKLYSAATAKRGIERGLVMD